MSSKSAISPTRQENFPEWYQSVVKAAEMAEMSSVRGCMIIRQWGYGIWQRVQAVLDEMIRDTGHENVYFPLFIPISYIEKEAEHVQGFAKEMAVVTHHRLEKKQGKLVPSSPLSQPLVVRPTSETMIGASMAKWVQSYRDLPLLLNQWANVVRWEMRPRIFLRTTEFLWQEGHTAHATQEEALAETHKMLSVYERFLRDELAIPIHVGEKPASERFPGALQTLCVEAMMQDGKALQAGTSHYLGCNFAKASGIRFTDQSGKLREAHTTSWGMTSRVIGALIMVHGDDYGLRLPPRIAPQHIVFNPFNDSQEINAYIEQLQRQLQEIELTAGRKIACKIDRRELRLGEKAWSWLKKGVPLILNIGEREVKSRSVTIFARQGTTSMHADEFVAKAQTMLAAIQSELLRKAEEFLQSNTRTDVATWEDFQQVFKANTFPLPFVSAKWCKRYECQQKAEKLAVTIRCLPLTQSETSGKCIVCQENAVTDAVFAKSY